MDLSGNMTRQIEQDMPVTDDSSHIVNVGRLVEDMELKMRNLLRRRTPFLFPLWSLLTFNDQKRYISEKQKMLWETSEVCCYLALLVGLPLTMLQAYHL